MKSGSHYIADPYQEHLTSYFKGILGTSKSKRIVLNNKSKDISNKEVDAIIGLLHEDYKSLDLTINIHQNRFDTFLQWMRPFKSGINKEAFIGASKGRYAANYNNKYIDIFLYNRRKKLSSEINKHIDDCVKLCAVYDLLHEIRHGYQHRFKKKRFECASRNYVTAERVGYHSQWVEIDANSFAQRMMNKNKDKINNILGVEFNWDCTWGYFSVDF